MVYLNNGNPSSLAEALAIAKETPKIELEFVLDPYNFPRDFEELSAQISDVL